MPWHLLFPYIILFRLLPFPLPLKSPTITLVLLATGCILFPQTFP
jgi:hypothetical protein